MIKEIENITFEAIDGFLHIVVENAWYSLYRDNMSKTDVLIETIKTIEGEEDEAQMFFDTPCVRFFITIKAKSVVDIMEFFSDNDIKFNSVDKF